jgi:hypothetical protein
MTILKHRSQVESETDGVFGVKIAGFGEREVDWPFASV